eukprot:352526-Chlamydomonas_euryale.AAC.2
MRRPVGVPLAVPVAPAAVVHEEPAHPKQRVVPQVDGAPGRRDGSAAGCGAAAIGASRGARGRQGAAMLGMRAVTAVVAAAAPADAATVERRRVRERRSTWIEAPARVLRARL